MFSSRCEWAAEPNPITNLLRYKHARGSPVLDLTLSNPTRAGFDYPVSEIVQALADTLSLQYDPDPAGLFTAREAVSPDSPDRVLLTASTSEAYSYLFKLLANPGDTVLAPRPSYPLFEHLAELESVRVVQYPLVYDGAWRIDLDALQRAVTPATRALIVVNPNNPTGSYLKCDERDRIVALCREHDLALICDEVFRDYAMPPHAPSLLETNEVLTFRLSGLSKVAGLPQMKLGWIVVNGPAAMARRAYQGLEWIADTYLSVGAPVQLAAPTLLALAPGIQRQIQLRLEQNLSALRAFAGAESPFNVLDVEGGWTAILQAPRIRTEEEWTLGLLRDCDVLVQPGYFYDFESEAYLVVSLLTPTEDLVEGLRRLVSY